jgi:hypothetical protein
MRRSSGEDHRPTFISDSVRALQQRARGSGLITDEEFLKLAFHTNASGSFDCDPLEGWAYSHEEFPSRFLGWNSPDKQDVPAIPNLKFSMKSVNREVTLVKEVSRA